MVVRVPAQNTFLTYGVELDVWQRRGDRAPEVVGSVAVLGGMTTECASLSVVRCASVCASVCATRPGVTVLPSSWLVCCICQHSLSVQRVAERGS
jgi:hypothetical protein